MKKVLILVLSTEKDWYKSLMETSLSTWDSVEVENIETLFYCGKSDKPNTDKIFYADIEDGFFDMGRKFIATLEYVLKNKSFDYIFRANASQYIDKKNLLKYAQKQPASIVSGVVAETHKRFMWGGTGFFFSKDIAETIVRHQNLWNHLEMEDVAISELLYGLNVPIVNTAKASSISLIYENGKQGYNFICYGNGEGGGCTIFDLKEINTHEVLKDQFVFRVKDDANRDNDIKLMKELYAAYNEN